MTRDQSIALHLAKVIGLKSDIFDGIAWLGDDDRGWESWQPQFDRAQCMEVVEWAVSVVDITISGEDVSAWPSKGSGFEVSHDGTPAGIRVAICEAVARASGWSE